jgi:DNA-binding protein HU-beta
MKGMKMTKRELVDVVAERNGLKKAEASQIVDHVLSTVVAEVVDGEDVNLFDFGKFKRVLRNEKQGRNPKTGETLTVPAHYVVTFKPAKSFVERLKTAK